MKITNLPIRSPCTEEWDAMPGGEVERHCDACARSVHDLSAMTTSEARELLASRPPEGLCVRYAYDDADQVLFLDTDPHDVPTTPRNPLVALAAGAMIMAAVGLSGCGTNEGQAVLSPDITTIERMTSSGVEASRVELLDAISRANDVAIHKRAHLEASNALEAARGRGALDSRFAHGLQKVAAARDVAATRSVERSKHKARQRRMQGGVDTRGWIMGEL